MSTGINKKKKDIQLENITKYVKKKFSKAFLIRKSGRFLSLSLIYIIIFGLAFMIIYPYFVKLITSFMSLEDLSDSTVKFIPKTFSLYFWNRAVKAMNIPSAFGNSLLISFVTAIIQVMICSFVGYGFARFKVPGVNLIFFLVIFTMLVPFTTELLPYYLKFRNFNLLFIKTSLIDTVGPNVILSLSGLGLKNGLYIYILRQFYRGMPKELEEAAYIDGNGYFRTYFLIMMPNAFSSMLTVFLFSFCWQWTDITYSSIFFSQKQTVVNAVMNIITSVGTDRIVFSTVQNIGTLIVMAPILLIFLVGQKYFIQGIERSGITF